jgi:DNA repair protein RadA/Sms
MTRTSVRYVCTACGYESPKWLGRCTECGEWGSLGETARPAAPRSRTSAALTTAPVPLATVDGVGAARLATGVPDLDRVLGGGLIPGSVTLIGGEPGIGKSTVLLQALGALARRGVRCLLVSAEESPSQVRLRADRLDTLAPELLVVGETSLPAIIAHVENVEPTVLAVDSIQTVHDPDAPGAPGSVTQVRDGAQRLVRLAKENDIATLLVGHVTKDGGLAGPRALEHVVDTVLSFEGDRHHALRMLRALKHRFGSTDELGLMEMTEHGLAGVVDPSALFLADRRAGAPGSAVVPVMEGSRTMCVEVQGLVTESGAGPARRTTQSLDGSRLALIVAVLQERGRVVLAGKDVFASVAGNVRVGESSADLGIALALSSSWYDHPLTPDTVVVGEIGLGGEVRQAAQTPRRLAEARRLGFRRAIVSTSTPDVAGMRLVRVATLADALDAEFSFRRVTSVQFRPGGSVGAAPIGSSVRRITTGRPGNPAS